MDVNELAILLDGAEETANLEFKGPMDWSAAGIARDILAMANTIDGGRLVFGVEDGSFDQVGLTEEQFATFEPEEMQDQVEPFADPGVAFAVSKITTDDGKRFVVVEVFPFTESPIICRKDKGDLSAGAIYIRPRTGRPKSRKIASSAEMRDLIDRAIAVNLDRFRRIGLLADHDNAGSDVEFQDQFDAEAKDVL